MMIGLSSQDYGFAGNLAGIGEMRLVQIQW